MYKAINMNMNMTFLFRSISNWLHTADGLPSYVFSCTLFFALCARSPHTTQNEKNLKIMSVICWIVYAIITISFVLNSVVFHLLWTSIIGIYWVTLTSIMYMKVHENTQYFICGATINLTICFAPFVVSILIGLFILEWNLVFVYFVQTTLLSQCLVVILYCSCFKHTHGNNAQRDSPTPCFVLWLSGVLLVTISVIYIIWKGVYSPKMTEIHSLCFALSVLSAPSALYPE
jgi:hypothetical protein